MQDRVQDRMPTLERAPGTASALVDFEKHSFKHYAYLRSGPYI